MAIDIDSLTIAELRQIAALANTVFGVQSLTPEKPRGDKAPYIVCTDKRGVVFGYTDDIDARPVVLTDARMCLYWSADIGGVFGLGEKGPTKDCKISATVPSIILEGVTAVMTVDLSAETAWLNAKVQGR
jgi:hypothetical protein